MLEEALAVKCEVLDFHDGLLMQVPESAALANLPGVIPRAPCPALLPEAPVVRGIGLIKRDGD